MLTTILIVSCLLAGLIAGLFYGYFVSVNIALGRLDNKTYVLTMQSINSAILNPWFFLSFMGTLVALPLSSILLYRNASGAAFNWMLAATIIYILGNFLVTAAGNVPLNNQLAAFQSASAADSAFAMARKAFEQPWNRLHNIRTIACILAFGCTIVSLIKLK